MAAPALSALRRPLPFAVAVLGVAILGGALSLDAADGARPPSGAVASVRVLVLGDTGTGEAGQYQVAAAASWVCEHRGCDLALLNGDNIYEVGVSGPYDPQFEAKFEAPYAAFAMPFWAVLGNHDNSGSPAELTAAPGPVSAAAEEAGLGHYSPSGDHQVAYHHRNDRRSDKWHMPARYYTFTAGAGLVQFFGLDSNTLVWLGDPAFQQDALGEAQAQWLRDRLAASEAPWRIVFAHHPYISNGQHGDAGWYEGEGVVPTGIGARLKLLVEQDVCGVAQLLLSGHDHDLQWLQAPEGCPGTEFLVSGAGAKTRPLADPERHAAWFQQGDTLGFAWLEFTSAGLTGAFYDGDGTLRFERTMPIDEVGR